MAHSYRFLDDIALADIAFEAEGDSPEDLFRAATQALLQTLADPSTVGNEWEHQITRADDDLATLLFDWLSEIVYWKDAAGVVFRDAVMTLSRGQGTWTLQARLVGSPVDRVKQELRSDVKGVTKHRYGIERTGSAWKATVVLDV